MQICMMDYNNLSHDGKVVMLNCYGVGRFEVFSGIEHYINNSHCSHIEKSAIPPGTYWIVDRPVGSMLNRIRAEMIDLSNAYKSNHSTWFGLFSADTMSDHMFVNGTRRGSFRLHPRNTDGSGVSWGCITLYRASDFQILRSALLSQKKVRVPGGRGLMAYGRIDVRGIPDFSRCNTL